MNNLTLSLWHQRLQKCKLSHVLNFVPTSNLEKASILYILNIQLNYKKNLMVFLNSHFFGGYLHFKKFVLFSSQILLQCLMWKTENTENLKRKKWLISSTPKLPCPFMSFILTPCLPPISQESWIIYCFYCPCLNFINILGKCFHLNAHSFSTTFTEVHLTTHGTVYEFQKCIQPHNQHSSNIELFLLPVSS